MWRVDFIPPPARYYRVLHSVTLSLVCLFLYFNLTMALHRKPSNTKGAGGITRPSPTVIFYPLLEKYKGNSNLNILDFSQLFVADAPMKKKITTSQSPFVFGR